jgi:L-seryl-tRNA(Ser) seleniumtransferase
VALGKDKKMPVIADLGSGALVDLRQYGLPYEPVASEYISAEVDLATFSGDKVLGGPQAGIIVGKKWAVDKCRKNHLMRALRCDKLTLAALEATLKTYLSPAELLEQNPTLKLLAEPVEQIRQRTEEFRNWLLDQSHPNIISAEVRPSIAQAGSGALPLEKIPSFAIHLKTTSSIVTFARKLRTGNPPVIGTIQNEELVLDFRTIFPSEMEILKKSIINNLTSIKIDI